MTIRNEHSDAFVRPMIMEDIQQIHAIETRVHTHPWTSGNFMDALQAGYATWVLFHPTLIGYALVSYALDEAHLLNIAIDKAWQGQGYGRLLLHAVLDTLRVHNMVVLFLEVRVSNHSAIALYESIGFNLITTRRGYYASFNGREDALVMGLML